MVNKTSNPEQLDWIKLDWFGQKISYLGPETRHKIRTKYGVYNDYVLRLTKLCLSMTYYAIYELKAHFDSIID